MSGREERESPTGQLRRRILVPSSIGGRLVLGMILLYTFGDKLACSTVDCRVIATVIDKGEEFQLAQTTSGRRNSAVGKPGKHQCFGGPMTVPLRSAHATLSPREASDSLP